MQQSARKLSYCHTVINESMVANSATQPPKHIVTMHKHADIQHSQHLDIDIVMPEHDGELFAGRPEPDQLMEEQHEVGDYFRGAFFIAVDADFLLRD